MANDKLGDRTVKTITRIRIVAGVVVASGAVWWFGFRGDGNGASVSASGTVEAREADLGFELPGRLASVLVREGDHVFRADTLATLDRSSLEARMEAVRASAGLAEAQLAELESGARSEEVRAARAARNAATRRLEDARRELERAERLQAEGAVSRQMLENAETAALLAESAHEQAVERLQILESGPRFERIDAARAAVRQANAAVNEVSATLAKLTVTAPFDGLITVLHKEPGEIVAPGQPVVTIMDSDDRWVRIYLSQQTVGRVSVGDSVTITADSYPDRTYGGRITHISNEAEFTPRNVQTQEERVSLVFEVRVAISHDPDFDLKPGLAADIRVVAATP